MADDTGTDRPFFPAREQRGTGQSPAAAPVVPLTGDAALRHLIPSTPDDTGTDWAATATEIEGFSCTNWECDHHECKFLRAAAVGLRRLAQLDTAESVGVDYCTLHHGIRNEDDHRCDMADDDLNPEYVFTTGQESVSYPNAGPDGEPRECVLVELIPRPAVLGSGEQPEPEPVSDESSPYCPCGGSCHRASSPCSLSCVVHHASGCWEQPEGPTTCPTCGSDTPMVCHIGLVRPHHHGIIGDGSCCCPDSWHGEQR